MKKSTGFTLIELLVTIVIIGILAAIAYPAYQDSVIKTRRSEAQSQLMQLASFMERKFTTDNVYNSNTAADTLSASGINNSDFYTYSIPTLTDSTFVLQATAKGGQTADSCGNLSLTNTGATAASGTGNCWP